MPRIDLSRRPPPKIGQLRDVVWLCVFTNRPPGGASPPRAAADHEPAGGLLRDRSRESGAGQCVAHCGSFIPEPFTTFAQWASWDSTSSP
jgi:hypothetical protein